MSPPPYLCDSQEPLPEGSIWRDSIYKTEMVPVLLLLNKLVKVKTSILNFKNYYDFVHKSKRYFDFTPSLELISQLLILQSPQKSK